MNRDREEFWDAVKGICIIAVILIHTTSRNSIGGVVWRQFINFPVAMFVFMAGYFCHVKGTYSVFIMKKAKRLLIPLAVASIVYGVVELYFGLRLGGTMTLCCIGSAFLSFSLGWGYFVLALFQCMIVAPFLQRYASSRWLLPLSLGLCLTTSLYMYLASTVFQGSWSLANSVPVIFCTAWLPFFVLGMKLQKRRLTVWAPGVRPYLAMVILMLFAIAGGVYWYKTATVQLARSQLRVPCILFSLVLAGLLPNLADKYDLRECTWGIVARLGEMSFFVYLWHRFILIFLRSILPQFAEWHFILTIALFALLARLLPHAWSKRLWWMGM